MALNNPWVGYITRNYLQIKTELLSRLGVSVPELSDHSQSNPLVVILDIFAGITEMLNYYIDNMAREAFISTARKYSSMVRLTRLIDYRIKSSIPSKVDVLVSFFDTNDIPLPVPSFIIPKGTQFNSLNNIPFVSISQVTVPDNATTIIIPCSQEVIVIDQLLGITTADLNQVFSLGNNYAHDSLDLKVGGEVWTLKNTLGRSTPQDKHFIIDISPDKIAYVRFGDGVNGAIPVPGLEVRGDYSTTSGKAGNVGIGSITSSTFNFTAQGVTKNVITNNLAAVAGSDFEDLEKIRRSAPLSIRTLDRAVTKQDYIDITKLAPGVDKANLKFECGKTIDIYIVPNGGGVAPQSLLDSTKDFVELRKMVTTFVNILPTGQSDIFIDIEVKARFRASVVQTEADIRNTLLKLFSYETSDVNKAVRISDVISAIDNLEKVDYVNVKQLYLIPYFRPTLSSTPEFLKNMSINKGSTEIIKWEAKSDGTNMILFKEGQQIATIPLNTDYTDSNNIFTLKVLPNSYLAGMVWEFTTYPYNANIELDNFSIPIITTDNILIKITETLTL